MGETLLHFLAAPDWTNAHLCPLLDFKPDHHGGSPKCVYEKYPLTSALLQGDLGDDAEVSSFRHTVGHVEVEALGDGDLTLGLLVLSATVVLLWTANSLHSDVGVAFAALGLAEVGEHQVSLHPRGNRDKPRDGGVSLHSYWPTRSSQEDGDASLWRYSEYDSF